MKIRILGGGYYGCHLAVHLREQGYDVELHEIAERLFAGASGNNPARLHCGAHYPRSKLTRAMCQEHFDRFMGTYGHLTHGIPCNIYAIAADHSYLDFGTYCDVLRGEIEFIRIDRPRDFGLRNVEGAILTGERHVNINRAREWFEHALGGVACYNQPPSDRHRRRFDLTIDCTFCARDNAHIDRYEPCVMGLLEGPTDRAVTIMDGPFPSLYPWDEHAHLNSLTSARDTPLERCATHDAARRCLNETSDEELRARVEGMVAAMAGYYPAVRDYRVVGYRTAIRALPLSGADARLVDIVWADEHTLRVRAGKIDAIFHAADEVDRVLETL